MKNRIIIKFDIFKTDIYFCYTAESYEKTLDKFNPGFNNPLAASGRCTELIPDGKSHKIIIGIDSANSQSIQSLKSTIVHEISHAVDYICDKYGFTCTEFRAYTLQYLYLNIIDYVDKKQY